LLRRNLSRRKSAEPISGDEFIDIGHVELGEGIWLSTEGTAILVYTIKEIQITIVSAYPRRHSKKNSSWPLQTIIFRTLANFAASAIIVASKWIFKEQNRYSPAPAPIYSTMCYVHQQLRISQKRQPASIALPSFGSSPVTNCRKQKPRENPREAFARFLRDAEFTLANADAPLADNRGALLRIGLVHQ
jgi:hypothetical protein